MIFVGDDDLFTLDPLVLIRLLGGVMNVKKVLLTVFLTGVFIVLNSFGSMMALGEREEMGVSNQILEVGAVDDAEMVKSLSEGVVYVSSKQICTQRMGCTCKHRRSDTDTLKKHTPEDDPYDDQNSWRAHLDIKCTKCNSKWYCPVFNRFRD